MTESKSLRRFKEDKKLPFLYLITNRKLCHPKPLEEVICKALDTGVRFIQLREKDLNSLDLYILAKKIKTLTSKYRAYFLINERIDIALAIDAEGVHLPEASLPVVKARKLLGNKKIIGKSTHLPISLSNRDYACIDFITLSPVFNAGGKDYKLKTIGINRFKKTIITIPVPVYGLGGIKPNHINELKNAGVSGIAISSGIMKAFDLKKKAKEYLILGRE